MQTNNAVVAKTPTISPFNITIMIAWFKSNFVSFYFCHFIILQSLYPIKKLLVPDNIAV